jgi:hypothetical protein
MAPLFVPFEPGYAIYGLRLELTVKPRPEATQTTPAMRIQIDLLVGEPVKNLETSEVNEWVALKPTIIRTTPPTKRMREQSLFIEGLSTRESEHRFAA